MLDNITPILEPDWLIQCIFLAIAVIGTCTTKATSERGMKLSLKDLTIEKLVGYYKHFIV